MLGPFVTISWYPEPADPHLLPEDNRVFGSDGRGVTRCGLRCLGHRHPRAAVRGVEVRVRQRHRYRGGPADPRVRARNRHRHIFAEHVWKMVDLISSTGRLQTTYCVCSEQSVSTILTKKRTVSTCIHVQARSDTYCAAVTVAQADTFLVPFVCHVKQTSPSDFTCTCSYPTDIHIPPRLSGYPSCRTF